MFVIQKIFNFIIFPPSIFIIILIVALWLLKKNYRRGLYLIVADILLIYVLSIEPVKNLLLWPLEDFVPPIDLNLNYNADLVVVLGGGIIEQSPDEEGAGSLVPESMKRVMYGLMVAAKYRVPVLFSGGKVYADQKEAEADIACRIARRYAPAGMVIYGEGLSRTTRENAVYVKEKFKTRRVILVTSAYHMKRALYSFGREGVDCVPAPTDYKIDSSGYNFTSFLPKTGEMDNVYRALKEYVGILFYMVK